MASSWIQTELERITRQRNALLTAAQQAAQPSSPTGGTAAPSETPPSPDPAIASQAPVNALTEAYEAFRKSGHHGVDLVQRARQGFDDTPSAPNEMRYLGQKVTQHGDRKGLGAYTIDLGGNHLLNVYFDQRGRPHYVKRNAWKGSIKDLLGSVQ